MRLLAAVAVAVGLFTTLAQAKPNIDKIMDTPCTPDNENETRCLAPKSPRAINAKHNYIVRCKDNNWHIDERCKGTRPCIDPELGMPMCWDDFDVEWDECPKGEVCVDKIGNLFEGYLYKPTD